MKFHLPLAFFCIAASALLFMVRQRLQDINFSYIVVVILGIAATLLFLFGVGLMIIFCGKTLHSTTQVVISSIPDEDLEKSPAPILPYSHIPHLLPFDVKACSTGLPGYFTAIQKFDDATFDSALNANVWREDVPETPPPCYEKALEMRTTSALLIAAANQVNTYSPEQYACFQETMDNSDELFV